MASFHQAVAQGAPGVGLAGARQSEGQDVHAPLDEAALGQLVQLLAHRHSVRLPTVITVRGSLDQADDFLRTRLDTADGFSKVYSLGPPVNVAMRKLGEIPAAMADRMTFDSFRTDGGGIFTPEEAAAFAVAHAYVKRWAQAERPNGWLMLMGPYGVGKTHLAVAACRDAPESGR